MLQQNVQVIALQFKDQILNFVNNYYKMLYFIDEDVEEQIVLNKDLLFRLK